MQKQIVDVNFTHWAKFIPGRRRKAIEGLFRSTNVAEVRRIDREEATVAFRITTPECDLSWAGRQPRNGPRCHYGWSENSIELLRYDNGIWWPLTAYPESWDETVPAMSVESCLEAMANAFSSTFFEFQTIAGKRELWPEAHDIRKVLDNDIGRKLADARRLTEGNLLFCGDLAYVRGGHPLYVKDHKGRKSTWIIKVARTVADRRGDYGRDRYAMTDFTPNMHNDRILASGQFWLPDETITPGLLGDDRLAADEARHPRQTSIPRIEVCDGTLVHPDRAQLTLDAIFRETVSLIDDMPRRLFNYHDDCIDGVKDLIEVIPDHDVLSRLRLGALREFFAKHEGGEHRFDHTRSCFQRFDACQTATPSWPIDLCDADFALLRTLMTD